MKVIHTVPEGYRVICSVDLQKNKKQAILVNVISFVIAIALVILGCMVIPITELFRIEQGIWEYLLRFGTLLLSLVGYIILHELVHGIAMKICGTKKVKYGFTGAYAFAGSDDLYGKGAYIFIALAPIVLWGLILLAFSFLVPRSWFWVVYFIQIINLSGAAGDLYVTVRFLKLPRDILVADSGVKMDVYSRESM